MRYIDSILAPGTIKTGVYVRSGRAYFIMGNYVGVVKPSTLSEWQILDLAGIPAL